MRPRWLTNRSASKQPANERSTKDKETARPAIPSSVHPQPIQNAEFNSTALTVMSQLDLKRRLKELDAVLQTMHLSQHTLSLVISGIGVQRDIAAATGQRSGPPSPGRPRVSFATTAGAAAGISPGYAGASQDASASRNRESAGSGTTTGSYTLKTSMPPSPSSSPSPSLPPHKNILSLTPSLVQPWHTPPTSSPSPRTTEVNAATLHVVRCTMQRAISTMTTLLRTLVDQVDRLEKADDEQEAQLQVTPPVRHDGCYSPLLNTIDANLSSPGVLRSVPYPRRVQISRLLHAWDAQWIQPPQTNINEDDDFMLAKRIGELIDDLRKICISIERGKEVQEWKAASCSDPETPVPL
jgi:hypothetical protein